MPYPTSSKQWVLAANPTDSPVISGAGQQTFRLETNPVPPLKDNQVLLRSLYFSNDPAQRLNIAPVGITRFYRPPVEVNGVMGAGALAEVVESTSDVLKPGMLTYSWMGWTEYAVIDAVELTPLPDLPGGLSVTQYLGSLGATGYTAYYGFNIIAEAKPEDVVVVSGAAGATGSMVIQMAKRVMGCRRVVGIAGGDKKCRWVEDYLGADTCVDYKSPSFVEDLVKATGGKDPDVSVYFDNVGGPILDLMLTRMAMFGRIAVCGAISEYNTNSENLTALKNWVDVIIMRIQIRGFLILDYVEPKQVQEMVQYYLKGYAEGKVKLGAENEQVVPAKFEDIPKVWVKLFEGGNTGKLVTKLEA